MTPRQHIYWHTTVRMPDDSDLTPLPEKVNVAIIGGGYTGLTAARYAGGGAASRHGSPIEAT